MLNDPRFFKTLYNTMYYVLLYVPAAIPVALGLALLLNAKVRGLSFWRTAFYLPQVNATGRGGRAVAAHPQPAERPAEPGARADRHPRPGLDDRRRVGQAGADYHAAVERWLNCDCDAGRAAAGAEDLYEAAVVDGANAIDRFFHITVPMISNVLFLCW